MRFRDYDVPDNKLYTKEHEWVTLSGENAVIGISDYAAKTLNDVVYLSLPAAGQTFKQFSSFGTVESIKAVSELYSPLSGRVTKVNTNLESRPELVNQSPYAEGWLIELKPSELDAEKGRLLNAQQYVDYLAGLDK